MQKTKLGNLETSAMTTISQAETAAAYSAEGGVADLRPLVPEHLECSWAENRKSVTLLAVAHQVPITLLPEIAVSAGWRQPAQQSQPHPHGHVHLYQKDIVSS